MALISRRASARRPRGNCGPIVVLFGLALLVGALGVAAGDEPAATPPHSASASAKLPDNGAGHTVAAFFTAFNSGDRAAWRRFCEQHGTNGPQSPPIEKRLETLGRLYAALGKLTVESVAETPGRLDVAVRTERRGRASLSFAIDTHEPFRLQSTRIEISE